MTKKLLITLSILTLFASCGTRRCPTTFDEGVVINGVRWATRNVDMPGTFAESPESFGMFFQWNRKKAWSGTDRYIEDWDDFHFDFPDATKWIAQNDPCPKGWRVPTRDEFFSLRYDVVHTWTTQNGVTGRLFGDAPRQIFLPAAGYLWGVNGHLERLGETGIYWSSDRVPNQPNRLQSAYTLSFHSNGYVRADNRGWCAFGFSVRCVAK